MSTRNDETGIFSFSPDLGTWSLGGVIDNASCVVFVDDEEIAVSALRTTDEKSLNDVFGPRTLIVASRQYKKFRFEYCFEIYDGKTSAISYFKIENTSSSVLKLGDSQFFILQTTPVLGPEPGDQTYFEFHDSLSSQNRMMLASECDENTFSTPFCHIHNSISEKTFFAGLVTFERMHAVFRFDYEREFSCEFRFGDVELPPGRSISTEKVFFEIAEGSPFRPIEKWASMVREYHNPPIPEKSPVGWIGSSWISMIGSQELPEARVKRNLSAIRERLKGFDIDYIWISIANLKDGLPGNWSAENFDNFPGGVRETLEAIKQYEFKPGLWVAPFYMNEKADDFDNARDHCWKDGDGNPIPYAGWLWAAKADEDNLPRMYHLDSTHPATEEYVRNVFTKYREWGVRYYMLDFLSSGRMRSGACPYDETVVGNWEGYRKCMRAIREAAGDDTHLLSAVGSSLWHIGILSASRIGMDYGEGRSLMPRFPSYPANYIINGSYGSAGSPNRNAVQNLACWYFAHRRFFLCDSNMLTVDKPIPLNEAVISASLFGISGGPMMMGDDIDTISEERLALIKKTLPRCSSSPIPVDLFTKIDSENHLRKFIVTISLEWGEWFILAVFNLNEKGRKTELTAEELLLMPGQGYRMFDFWQERYCGIFRDETEIEIPGETCRVFRLEKEKTHPWILSTDMHVRQGEAELLNVEWNSESEVLSGTASRPAGERGNIYIIAPWNFKEKNLNRGLWVAKSATDDSLIIRKSIYFEQEKMDWRIEFKKLDEKEIEWRDKNKAKFNET